MKVLFQCYRPNQWRSPGRQVPTQERWQLSGHKNDRSPFPVPSRVSPLTNHREECGLHSSTEGKAFSQAHLLNSTFYMKISRYTGWGGGWGGVLHFSGNEKEKYSTGNLQMEGNRLLFAPSLHLPVTIGILRGSTCIATGQSWEFTNKHLFNKIQRLSTYFLLSFFSDWK